MDLSWLEPINAVMFWVLVFMLVWQAYILLFHKGVPNISTAPAIQREVAQILKDYVAKTGKKQINVIDLGSGDGAWTRHVAKQLPEANVVGLEFAWPSFLWSRFLARVLGFKNLSYQRADFFAYDMSQVDAVMMYQSVFLIERISQKLKSDLKPGAIVLSNRYALKAGWEPTEHRVIRSAYLHQKDLYIYYKS